MDTSAAPMFGLFGLVNMLVVLPAPGVGRDELTRAFFGRAAVASIRGASALIRSIREPIDDFLGVIRVIELAALLLALLIAFNSIASRWTSGPANTPRCSPTGLRFAPPSVSP